MTSLADAMSKRVPSARTGLGAALRREGVRRAAEFRRIAALPTRRLVVGAPLVDPAALTAMLRAPGADGSISLFEDQATAISEIYDNRGGMIGMDVGAGKSLIIECAAVVVGAQRPLAIMPASARENFAAHRAKMAQHFTLTDRLMVASYEQLSTVNGKDFLNARMPDWIFCDEAHYLKDETAARTARFLRYLDEYPDTRLAAFSGSFLDRSVKAFAHIARWALRGNSPIPLAKSELDAWCLAVDADVEDEARMGIGALEEFLDLLTPEERRALDGADETKRAQAAFGARLAQTPGVVFSTVPPTTTALHIRELPVDVPRTVLDAFDHLRTTWETPQGDEITDAKDLYRTVRQLAQGFFYRWVWPNNEPMIEWIDARRAWHRFVRRTIAYSRAFPFDSMKEVKDACERHETWALARDTGMRDVVADLEARRAVAPMLDSQEWRTWQRIEPRYTPVVETVWIDKFLVQRTAEWLDERPGIAWVESQAMGEEIRKAGFRYYRGGENEIIYETASCAAALKAHHFAKNLQQFDRNLVVTPPGKGEVWRQLIGRTDRTGQRSQIVTVDLFLHVRELWTSFHNARRDAQFSDSPGGEHKLTKAQIALLTTLEDIPDRIMSDSPLWRYSSGA